MGVGRVKMDNAPRAPRCKAAGKEKHRMRGSKSVRKRPNRTNDFCSRLGGRIVTDALRRPSCQKCHLTGVLAWLINGTGKCDEGPASVSLHVRFRSTHAPAPVARIPVWPGPSRNAAKRPNHFGLETVTDGEQVRWGSKYSVARMCLWWS